MAPYRKPNAQELGDAKRLQLYFPWSIVWAYLDGDTPGLWVWQKSNDRRSMNAKARAGYAVVMVQ